MRFIAHWLPARVCTRRKVEPDDCQQDGEGEHPHIARSAELHLADPATRHAGRACHVCLSKAQRPSRVAKLTP